MCAWGGARAAYSIFLPYFKDNKISFRRVAGSAVHARVIPETHSGGGLFITPKLFDLHGLSKIVEEENVKKEQNKRTVHQQQ